MIEFTITITGTHNLLMHNSRLSNPLDSKTKELKRFTGKRSKTDEDHEMVSRCEFAGGLYFDPDLGPFIPGENVMRCLVDGAKLTKQGVKVTRGVFIKSDVNPLAYNGPRDEQGMWDAKMFNMSSVKVGTQRVMRCRPEFQAGWRVQAEGMLDPSVLELTDLNAIAANAGRLVGLGDWRPRFGRFEAEIERV